ncbi:hypothetical protein L6164_018643 [Bauhinia variegata]|uniref:Uncharacterized protein n=1 Tax=Bauhinia variegata TaxID=167791 RepID=A0ACB9NDV6_BAUVA|nr:hypothetical protein L6164_018643 [Bauhinia variegata]
MQRNNNSGSNQACAACKHQRKKCSENCALAPYFPASRNHEFHAVHKVFGVSNITKIVKNAKEEDRRRVVDSLIWEAFCRQKDPILGPYGEYRKVYDEYKKAFDELKIYRSQQNQVLQLPSQQGNVNFKSLQDLVAWNGTKGILKEEGVDNALSYAHDHSEINANNIDSTVYTYHHSNYLQSLEDMRPEAITQPYYISGRQYSQMNSKSMEGSIWEGEP